MTTRVGINGFGRMGRATFRVLAERDLDIEVVAINELGPAATMVDLLARDSVHGRFSKPIELGEGAIHVDGKWTRLLAQPDPAALPWVDLGVTVVVEATGRF